MFSLLLATAIIGKFNTVFSADCFDSDECQFATITDDALCYGYWSCFLATINGTSAECAGKFACSSASITTNGSVECSGDVACFFATISSDQDIDCEGKHACGSSTIKAKDDIDCTGYLGCGFAEITAKKTVSADGDAAVFYSNVTAEYVYGYGYFSLALASLDSKDLEEMSVSCYGYSGGYSAEFICRSGSECRLFCRGNCCSDMDYVCMSGSVCSVLCNEESGDECPTLNISSSSQNDDELVKYLVNKQNVKKHDRKYIEMRGEMEKIENVYNTKRDNNAAPLLSVIFDGNLVVSDGSFFNSSVLIASLITFIMTFVMVYYWFSIKYKDNEYKPLFEI